MLRHTAHSRSDSSVKFVLPCDNMKKNSDWLEVKGYLTAKKFNILVGHLKHHKSVVIKFGNIREIQHEYNVAKMAYEQYVPNIIKFLCSFICNDSIESIKTRDFLINTRVCEGPENTQIGMILMPYYQLGSLEDYRWDRSNFQTLKAVLRQVAYALLYAYQRFNFVHGDMHVANILMRRTKKQTVTYGDNTLPCYGLYPMIMDFGRSKIQEHSVKEVYQNIDRLLSLVDNMKNSDLAIVCDRDVLVSFIQGHKNIDDTVYKAIHDMIENIRIRYVISELPQNPFS